MMHYRETRPSPRLAEYVKCFWALDHSRCSAPDEPEPVVPDGSVEIVFNLSDRFRRYHQGGDVETQPASLIAGQMSKSVLIGPSGNVRLFGIRFKPAGAFPFFRFDICELADRIEPLDAVWGSAADLIGEQLSSTNGFEKQVVVAEAALAERLCERTARDAVLQHAVEAISRGGGAKRVRSLARELALSERGLERRFNRFVGLTPKTFSRIVRFQKVLRHLGSAAERDILETALSFGYYDQSHLINDFRQFAGSSPTSFMEATGRMTELFIASE